MTSTPRDLYTLGDLTFTIRGTGPVVTSLREEFAPCSGGTRASTLDYEFVDDLRPLQDFSRVGVQDVADGSCIAGSERLRFRLERHEERLQVDVLARPRIRRFPRLRRFVDWNYLHSWEQAAKTFLYDVFDFSSQLAHLSLGSSYLHASSFSRDDRCVAIAAWGGIGKTTTMLKLVLEDGWQFLSDDLALVRHDGTMFRSPKRMQIYGYNVQGEPLLAKALLSGRSLIDRASWERRLRFAGPKLVRRRVSAETLFGPQRVAKEGRLTDLFFLERTDRTTVGVSPLTAAACAERCASILLQELQPFTSLSVAQHSTLRRPVLPTAEDLRRQSQAVFERAFAGVTPYSVQVPLRAGPADLARLFRDHLDR